MSSVIYIGVFLSSIVGLNFGGISVNKIAIIPFEIYLIYKVGLQSQRIFKLNKTAQLVLIWYLINAISTITGLAFIALHGEQYFNDVLSSEMLWLFQLIFFYIPITLMIGQAANGKEIVTNIRKALVLTAKIQAIWAIVQVVLYYLFDYDLNYEFFNVLLKQNNDWTGLSNLTGKGILLRPTGLNHDPAFLGLIMVLAIILDTKMLWKAVYTFVIIMAFSRSALLTVVFLAVYSILTKVFQKSSRIIPVRKILRGIIVLFIAVVVFIYLYNNVPFIQSQFTRMGERLGTFSTGEDGTSRHIFYPLGAVIVWLFNLPILQKILGIGMSISGAAFNIYSGAINFVELTQSMKTSATWSIECEYATVLLGTGLVGLIAYLRIYLHAFLKTNFEKVKAIAASLLVFGIMYNFSGLTIFQFLLWGLILLNQIDSSQQTLYTDEKHDIPIKAVS